jgi:hypothetical protein
MPPNACHDSPIAVPMLSPEPTKLQQELDKLDNLVVVSWQDRPTFLLDTNELTLPNHVPVRDDERREPIKVTLTICVRGGGWGVSDLELKVGGSDEGIVDGVDDYRRVCLWGVDATLAFGGDEDVALFGEGRACEGGLAA